MSVLASRWRASLVPRSEWRPYPAAADRSFWDGLPADVRTAWLEKGDAALAAEWPELRATQCLEFVRSGSRGAYEGPHFTRRVVLRDLVVAECVEGSGRFVDAVADAVWSTCEESWWGWSAHLYWQRAGNGLPDVDEPTIDLGTGETIGLLAWTDYLLGDALDGISPLLRRRLRLEARRRVIEPYLTRDDHWWQAATNNWNPWCTSNVLAGVLLLEDDEDRRAAAAAKALASLDVFVDGYPADGACDEGATYWTRAAACLFDALDLLGRASSGDVELFDAPVIQEMARYPARVYVGPDWTVNFSDGTARFRLPGFLLYRFGRAIGDDTLMALGAEAAARSRADDASLADSMLRLLPALTLADEVAAAGSAVDGAGSGAIRLDADVWLGDTEVFVAREFEEPGRGLFVAAKGGHNDESHNHNDVGSFVVYADGEPLLVDPGVIGYTAKTFGKDRYDIWTMQSQWHNLPTIGGTGQAPGRSFAASSVSARPGRFEADLANAYPAAAGATSWRRRVALRRDASPVDAVVEDQFHVEPGTPVVLHLIAPGAVTADHGVIDLDGRASVAIESTHRFEVVLVERPLVGEDAALVAVWGDRLTRIDIALTADPPRGTVRVRVIPHTAGAPAGRAAG